VTNKEPFSDDECVESDDDYDREFVRTSIYEGYLNTPEAAAKLGVGEDKIKEWTQKMENSYSMIYKKISKEK